MKYINDLMDVLQPASEQTAQAQLYVTRPLTPTDGAISFAFSYVDPHSRSYSRLMGSNIQNVTGTIAIKTRQRLPFKIGKSEVVLPDGTHYLVREVMTDYNSVPQQVLRLWGAPVGAARLIRLEQVESPWTDDED